MNASETDAALHDKRRWTVLFAATIFLSAFLLFQVQPLISKRILPWFGGSPAVWTTAMLFFQCLLFAGYAYAHGIVRYGTVRQQTLVHFGLLGLATVGAFFVLPHDRWKPAGDEQPVAYILALLAACVGLPYFCLAITGPLLQYWFSLLYPNRSPYRLYAISNIGSFLALLSFPFVMEPSSSTWQANS